jgi:hypothetical protein
MADEVAEPDLVEGTIVECLNEFWCDEVDLFAICVNRQYLSPRIRVFLDRPQSKARKSDEK